MSTISPSGRSKKLVPEFLEGIKHDQNMRHQPLSSPRSRMGNFAALVKIKLDAGGLTAEVRRDGDRERLCQATVSTGALILSESGDEVE